TVGGFILSIIFKILPSFVNLQFLYQFGFAVPNAEGVYEIPFIDRMGFVFIICVIMMFIITKLELGWKGTNPKGLDIDAKMFRVSPGFAVGALIIIGILVALYTVYW